MRYLKEYIFIGLWLLVAIPHLLAQQSSISAIDQNGGMNLPILKLAALPDTTLILDSYTSVLVDPTKKMQLDSARTLWTAGKFEPLVGLKYPSKFESGNYHYWLQFQVENTSEDTLDIIFRLSRLDSNFYYQFIDNQLDRAALFGNQLSLNARFAQIFD